MTRELTVKQVRKDHDSRNREAAMLIIADPRYQGIMHEWAQTFLRRLELEEVEPYELLRKLAARAAA